MYKCISTHKKREIIDITNEVARVASGDGVVNVFIKHTTAAVTLADLDPGTDEDYLTALGRLTPDGNWQHPHDPDHFPDHLWSSLIGQTITVPVQDNQLVIGQWQRIILIELDGPRDRELEITVLKGDS